MSKPKRPYVGYPLGPWPNGQWGKKIKGGDGKSRPYYFGSWRDDLSGLSALKEYNDRLPGIMDGTDHLRQTDGGSGLVTVGDLMKQYLAHCLQNVKAKAMSDTTYGDYCYELGLLSSWLKSSTPVAALKPEHFAAYNKHLIETRKLASRSRRRAISYIKAMFRWGGIGGISGCPLPLFGPGFKAPTCTTESVRKEKARAGIADYSDRLVTGSEIDRLLADAQPNMRAIILLGINCGLGPADIGRMKWHHVDMSSGKLNYPRHKTGNERVGYLWKRTREAIEECRKLKHTAAAIERDGQNAFVFITRKREPYYREVPKVVDGKRVGTIVHNAISITFGRLAKDLNMTGVTFYRLRHTFKTLGKRAKDRDALNLCMGHKTNSVEEGYDHEQIRFKRVKRVALKVKSRLWPAPKQTGNNQASSAPQMKIGGDGDDSERAAA